MFDIDVQYADDGASKGAPPREQITRWVVAVLAKHHRNEAELTVRIVGLDEITELNQRYRKKAGPTNVLSFPFEAMPGVALPLLGDIIICTPVVEREAAEQGKYSEAHWAHMVIHGTLHLLGYDHIDEADALQMEGLETAILANLGYPNPYTHTEMEHL